MPRRCAPRSLSGLGAVLAAIAVLVVGFTAYAQNAADRGEDAARFAGHYKIDVWEKLERQKIMHWFWLKPDGGFEAGADWPYHEQTKFFGTWTLSGDRIVLQGKGEVWTNQGTWRTGFTRGYVISEQDGTITLTPVPEKNRYGLMGWPNAFVKPAEAPAGQ